MTQILLSIGLLSLSLQAFAVKNSCEQSYVPEYDMQLLRELNEWGRMAAFATYAEKAGFVFDKETYKADCPDYSLFGFGIATATQCLEMDLSNGYVSSLWVLDNLYGKSLNPENGINFQEAYYKMAVDSGADIYLL